MSTTSTTRLNCPTAGNTYTSSFRHLISSALRHLPPGLKATYRTEEESLVHCPTIYTVDISVDERSVGY